QSGVPRYHQLFIGRDHPGGDLARASGDSGTITPVGLGIELNAEPCRRLTDAAADLRGVLSDAGRKYQAIDPAQSCSHSADLLCRAVDEVVDGQASVRFTAGLEISHIVAYSGDAEQARLLVQDSLDLLNREFEVLEKVENCARINRARPCTHAEAIQRCKTETTIDAFSVF